MKIKQLFAFLLAWATPVATYGQSLDKAKLDLFFDRLAAKDKSMGSLALAKNGDVLYTRAIGYARIAGAEKRPLSTTTRQRVGSITKMITATIVLQLVEEGSLKLTDTLDRFFPQVPNAERITIAQLLAHRSGVRDLYADAEFRTSTATPRTQEELVAVVATGTADFEPDAKYAYSNSGYVLLALIVEKLTGKSFSEAVEVRIASKIGLKDTYVATGAAGAGKNEALSYVYANAWSPIPESHPSNLVGYGSLVSTPADLVKFAEALFNLKLVSRTSLDRMTKDKLGMQTFTIAGKTLYGHTGSIDGFNSGLVYLPEERLAAAYVSNGKVYPTANIVSGVLDIYWNRPFQIPTFESLTLAPEVLDRYVGTYTRPGVATKMTVTRQGTILYAQMGTQPALPLEAKTSESFLHEASGMVFEFDAAKGQATVKHRGREMVLTKDE